MRGIATGTAAETITCTQTGYACAAASKLHLI
jgi:hypothetical protein